MIRSLSVILLGLCFCAGCQQEVFLRAPVMTACIQLGAGELIRTACTGNSFEDEQTPTEDTYALDGAASYVLILNGSISDGTITDADGVQIEDSAVFPGKFDSLTITLDDEPLDVGEPVVTPQELGDPTWAVAEPLEIPADKLGSVVVLKAQAIDDRGLRSQVAKVTLTLQ